MNEKRSAAGVGVTLLRNTLFWPLTLDLPSNARDLRGQSGKPMTMVDFVAQQVTLLPSVWNEVDDTLEHIVRPENRTPAEQSAHDRAAYAEYTFFHDFIQRFLYTKQDSDEAGRKQAPFRLFRRSDVAFLDLTIADGQCGGDRVLRFHVERLSLYVFRTGVAILALELALPSPACIYEVNAIKSGVEPELILSRDLMLTDVLDVNDRMRRAHAPYLEQKKDDCVDTPPRNLLPLRHAWRGPSCVELASFDTFHDVTPADRTAPPLRCELRDMEKDERRVRPLRAFSWLLSDPKDKTRGWPIAPPMSKGVTWRHVADDRLALLSTVMVNDRASYEAIRDGDWMRLCFVDGHGSNPFPYAERFLRASWQSYCYDRFHYEPGENTFEPVRYLISGYSFVAVGCGWFFGEHIQTHMRRHYFQLMLLAQHDQATLLSFSSRVTRAVSDFECNLADKTEAAAESALEDDLQMIERDFLHYVHRFRFTGVTSQLQPSEMFDMLRRQMKLDALYADIKEELTTANDFLFRRSEQRTAVASERLNIIAVLGVVAGLALSFLGMNVLVASDFLDKMGIVAKTQGWAEHVALVFLVLGVFSLGGRGLSGLLGRRKTGETRVTEFLNGALSKAAMFLFILSACLFAYGRLAQRPHYVDDIQETQLCERRDGTVWCAVAGAKSPPAQAAPPTAR